MENSRVRVESRAREQVAIISTKDSSTVKMLSIPQPISLQEGGKAEVCSPEPAADVIPAEVKCLLSSGSEGRKSAVIHRGKTRKFQQKWGGAVSGG